MSDMQVGITIRVDTQNAGAAVRQVRDELNRLPQSGQAGAAALERMGQTAKTAGGAVDGFSRSAHGLIAAWAGISVARASVEGFARSVQGLAEAGAQLDRINGLLAATAGSAQAGAAHYRFVAKVANDLGLEVNAAAAAFAKLTAAAQGTAMQGQATRDLFVSISRATAGLGMSAAEADGVFLAVAQMLSKGVINAEELRGQLGERLPGAIAAMARQMGLSMQDFTKKLESGSLEATQSVMQLAKGLDSLSSTARFDHVGNEINRLSNAWTEFKRNVIDTQGMARAIRELTGLLQGFTTGVQAAFGSGPEAQIAALQQRIGEQRRVLEQMRSLKGSLGPLGGLIDTDEMAQREQSIKDMERALADLQRQSAATGQAAEQAATQGFHDLGQSAAQATVNLKKSGQELVTATAQAFKLNAEQQQVVAQIVATAEKSGFDPSLLLAIAKTESSFNRLAKAATTSASGVFQFVKGTRDRFGLKDPFNVEQSTIAAIKYLTALQDQFKNTRTAVSAYYSGEGAIQKNDNQPDAKGAAYAATVAKNLEAINAALGVAGKSWDSYADRVAAAAQAFDRLQAGQQAAIQQAEAYAQVQSARIKTSLAALQTEAQAQQQANAAALAGATTYAEKARLTEQAAQQAAAFHASEQSLILAEIDQQRQLLEAKRAAYQTELSGAGAGASERDRVQLQEALRAVSADLLVLEQQRAQAAMTYGAQLNATDAQNLQLKAQEVQFIATANTEYTQQLAILQALTQAKQQGATTDQLAMLRKSMEGTNAAIGAVSPETLKSYTQLHTSLLAIRQANDDLTGSLQDQRSEEQKVADEQLRLNQSWDEAAQRMIQYAEAWEKAFGRMGQALSGTAKAMAIYEKNLKNIERDRKAGVKNATSDQQAMDVNAQAHLQTLEASLNAMADVAGAMQTLFKEGSSGYRAMAIASEVFRVAAMLTNITLGIQAVVAQLAQGEVYTAIPRALAVAAMVASLIGQAVGGLSGGGGSSGGGADAKSRQASAGTGTVFGDPSAQSESISKSLELIAQNSSNDLSYSAAMLKALQGIEAAIQATSNAYIISFNKLLAGAGVAPGSLADNKDLQDWGISFPAKKLGEIINKGLDQGVLYVDTMRMGHGTKTTLANLGYGPAAALTKSLRSIRDALLEGGKAFGLTADDFNARLKDYVVDLGLISLKGLSADQIEKQLNAILSNQSDQMAQRLMPGLKQFQQAGEGYAQTFWRMAEGINRSKGELEQLGMTAVSYTEIANKQGDIAAEIVRTTLERQAQVSDGVRQYLSELTGSAEDIIAAYKKLVDASNLMKTAGVQGGDANLDRTMINAAGGLDAFTSAMQNFNESFLTEAQQIAGSSRVLAEQFLRLGVAMPASKDAFLALMQGLDTSTESGKKLFGALLQLADSFGQVQDQIQGIQDRYADILNPFGKYGAQIDTVIADFNTLIGDSAAKFQSAIDQNWQDLDATVAGKEADKERVMADIAEAIRVQLDYRKRANAAQAQLDAELAKPAKKQDKALIASLELKVANLKFMADSFDGYIAGLRDTVTQIDQEIADLIDQGWDRNNAIVADKERARAKLLEQAGTVLTDTVGKVFDQIIATVDAANQRLANVVKFQADLQTQLAQLEGPDAYARLMASRYAEAMAAGQRYLDGLAQGAARNVETELQLLTEAKTALMNKYQAELAAVQQLQQAVDSLASAITSIKSQIATLQGPGAVAGLAGQNYNAAGQAIRDYIDAIKGGATRDYAREIAMIQAAQQAVMDKYNAEMALIQEAIAAQTEALNAWLNAQIEAINAATQAQIDAINKALEAQIEAINAASQAAIKAQQKVFDAANKAQQKAFDAQNKAQQKAFDAANKAQQKAYDAINKAQQKANDAQLKALQKAQAVQMKGLQAELDAATKLRDAVKSIADYARGMTLGGHSPLSPEQRLQEAQRQYQDLLRRAQSGDADAMAQLSGASDAYLEAAKNYYGSGTQYANIFDGVKAAMSQLGAMQTTDPDSIQARIDALSEAQTEALDRLRELQQAQLDLLREQQQEQLDAARERQQEQMDAAREAQQATLDAIREQQQAQIEAMQKAAQDQIKAAQDAAKAQQDAIQKAAQAQITALQQQVAQQIKDLSDPNKNQAIKALKDAAIADLQKLQALAEQSKRDAAAQAQTAQTTLDSLKTETVNQLKELARLTELARLEAQRQAEQAREQARQDMANAYQIAQNQLIAMGLTTGFTSQQVAALTTIAQKLDPNFMLPPPISIPAMAQGGYTAGGLALVGEEGPELVRFVGPSQVIPAPRTRDLLGQSDGGQTFAALDDLKRELRALVTVQRHANPALIEELQALRARLEAIERQARINPAKPVGAYSVSRS